jgi:3-mercaptopyruvate sulfurtransferase SseA
MVTQTLNRPLAMLVAPLLLIALAVVAGGCGRSTSDRDLVYRRPNEVVELANTPTGAFGAGGVPRVLWLDPRTPAQFAEGHIPQATNIPFPEIERTHEATCRGFEMFIVYDTDYDDVLSKAAAKRLMELGYKNVYSLLGGLKAWKSEGYPVEKSPTTTDANPTSSRDASLRNTNSNDATVKTASDPTGISTGSSR